MKALSIRQPWPHSIIHLGKPVENRAWMPGGSNLREAHNLIGQEIFLHAGKGTSRGEYEDARAWIISACGVSSEAFPARADLPRGGIVGRAKLIGVIHKSRPPGDIDRALHCAWHSPWFHGPYGLVLAEAKPTKFVPMTGTVTPMFFDVPDAIVREALAA